MTFERGPFSVPFDVLGGKERDDFGPAREALTHEGHRPRRFIDGGREVHPVIAGPQVLDRFDPGSRSPQPRFRAYEVADQPRFGLVDLGYAPCPRLHSFPPDFGRRVGWVRST